MVATHGRKAQVLRTSRPALTMTSLVLQDTGDHKTFKIAAADAAKKIWDNTAPLTVQTSPDGSTGWTTVTNGVVRFIDGQVTFASAITGTTPSVRVTGKYLPYAAIAWANSWTPDVSRDIKEDTRMTTNTTPTRWRTFVPGLLTGTFKLSGFILDETVDVSAVDTDMTDEIPLIVELVIDVTTGAHLACAGLMSKDSLDAPLDDLEKEDQEFQITGQVYVLAS